MKFYFTCISTFYYFMVFSQQTKVIICDSINKEPVPFAMVQFLNNQIVASGRYSNDIGQLSILKNDLFDSINIVAHGFESKKIARIKDTIFITKLPITLDNVNVNAKQKIQPLEAGNFKLKKKSYHACGMGIELVNYIANNFGERKNIKSLICRFIRRKKFVAVVRLHFYQVSDSLTPGHEINTKNLIYYISGDSNEKHEIDVDSLNIEFSEKGIFAGIEWLGEYDLENNQFIYDESYDTTIEMNDELSVPITFSRSRIKMRDWSNFSVWIKNYQDLKWKNYPNSSFGLKVY